MSLRSLDCVLVAQLSPTLCDPMDCNLTSLLCQWNSPGKNSRVGCCSLLQEIFPTQGLNSGLSHCRQILYCLSYQGSPETAKLSSNVAGPFYIPAGKGREFLWFYILASIEYLSGLVLLVLFFVSLFFEF